MADRWPDRRGPPPPGIRSAGTGVEGSRRVDCGRTVPASTRPTPHGFAPQPVRLFVPLGAATPEGRAAAPRTERGGASESSRERFLNPPSPDGVAPPTTAKGPGLGTGPVYRDKPLSVRFGIRRP